MGGTTANPFQNIGVFHGLHTVIAQQGTDPNTGGKLSLLPADESKVVRLGLQYKGVEATSVTYHFKVDGDKPTVLSK